MNRCKRCGRKIWVAESVKREMGPVCAHIRFLDKIWWTWQQVQARRLRYGR